MKTISQTLSDILFVHIEKNLKSQSFPLFHKHNAYEIYILTRGNRTMYIGDEIYSLTAGDASMIKPDVPHRSSGNDVFDGICIEFSEECIRNNFLRPVQKKILDCFEKPIISLPSDITRLLFEKADIAEQEEALRYEFLLLTTECLSVYTQTTNIDIKRTLNSDISPIGMFIQRNYLSIKSLEDIASRFNMTKNHLCFVFKKQTGMTVFQYINQLKIQHALGLLQETDIPISEIRTICGFERARHFNEKFKEIINQTPREVRKLSHDSKIYIREYEEE